MYLLKKIMGYCKKTDIPGCGNIKKINLIALLSLSILFSGCFLLDDDGNTDDVNIPFSGKVVVTAVASDFSSGAHSILTYNKPRTATNDIVPTVSDIAINAYGEYFYRIERNNYDTVTKFSSGAPGTPMWQFTTMDGNDTSEGITSSNPQQLVFVSDTKAYLIRYGSKRAWIVNPSATTQAGFKTGELDLASYVDAADTDGDPEMVAGVLSGGKLFIIMQRLDGWTAVRPGYAAVFDVNTDAEIDTDLVNGGLFGIELTDPEMRNPTGITAYNGKLYVSSLGNYFDQGGIDEIDATTYAVTNRFNGNPIGAVAIVNSTTGYYIDYISWGNTKIIPFNPADMSIGTEVTGIGNDHRALAVDPDSRLWVADGTSGNSGIYIINTIDNSVDEGPVSTNLVPAGINFVD